MSADRFELQVRADACAELAEWVPDPTTIERARRAVCRPAAPRRLTGTAGGLVVGALLGAALLVLIVGLASMRSTAPTHEPGGELPMAVHRAPAEPRVVAPAVAATPEPRRPAAVQDAAVVASEVDPRPAAPAHVAAVKGDPPKRRRPRTPVPDLAPAPADAAPNAAELFADATAARERGAIAEALRLLARTSKEFPKSREGLTALVVAARIHLESKDNPRRALSLYRLYLRRAPQGTLHKEAKAGVVRAKERLEERGGR